MHSRVIRPTMWRRQSGTIAINRNLGTKRKNHVFNLYLKLLIINLIYLLSKKELHEKAGYINSLERFHLLSFKKMLLIYWWLFRENVVILLVIVSREYCCFIGDCFASGILRRAGPNASASPSRLVPTTVLSDTSATCWSTDVPGPNFILNISWY